MANQKYDDAHSELIEASSYVEVFGLQLDPNEYQAGSDRWKRSFPIILCFCVHDSPSSPCPCTGPILWLRRDDVLRSNVHTRKGERGGDVMRFVVDRDASVVVENASRLPISAVVARETAAKTEFIRPFKQAAIHAADFEKSGLLHNRLLDKIYSLLDAN